MSDMTEREAYKILSEASGIKQGDTVKVLRKAKEGEMGWGNYWVPGMDKAIGKSLRVERIDVGEGAATEEEQGLFPFFVLEIIEKAKPEPERKKMAYKSKIVIREKQAEDTVRAEDFDDEKVYAFFNNEDVFKLQCLADQWAWVSQGVSWCHWNGWQDSPLGAFKTLAGDIEVRQFPTLRDFRLWMDDVCNDVTACPLCQE